MIYFRTSSYMWIHVAFSLDGRRKVPAEVRKKAKKSVFFEEYRLPVFPGKKLTPMLPESSALTWNMLPLMFAIL